MKNFAKEAIALLLPVVVLMAAFVLLFGRDGDWRTFTAGAIAWIISDHLCDLVLKDLLGK